MIVDVKDVFFVPPHLRSCAFSGTCCRCRGAVRTSEDRAHLCLPCQQGEHLALDLSGEGPRHWIRGEDASASVGWCSGGRGKVWGRLVGHWVWLGW